MLLSFTKNGAYFIIIPPNRGEEIEASFAIGCDLKVLKRSAGGIATRRARPIRFVRVLAAGFAALRAFPSKAALSSAHFRPAPIGLVSPHFDFPFVRGPSRTRPLTPGRPRVDSLPPLSRCPRALRSARANSTPVDSCRLLSIRLLTHAAPHARGPSRTRPRSHSAPLARPRRAEPPQCRVDGNRRESTGIGLRGEAGRKDPHKSRRSHLCVRRSRLRENSSWVQQEKKPHPRRTVIARKVCGCDGPGRLHP